MWTAHVSMSTMIAAAIIILAGGANLLINTFKVQMNFRAWLEAVGHVTFKIK